MSAAAVDWRTRWRRFRRENLPDPMIRLLRRELDGLGSVLDVGCGSDSPLQFVHKVGRKVGVDAFAPSIEASRARGLHDDYLQLELESLAVEPKSYDAVVLLDLIEHFEKDAGLAFLGKLEANPHRMQEDLDNAWEVLAEPVQTVMRRYGLPNPYEQLKALTRGQGISAASMGAFIDSLELPEPAKHELPALTPGTYTGAAESLARAVAKA